MNKHIIDDARRCLQCKNPHCMQGCPVRTPIKEAIHLLLGNQVELAGRLLFENNPLSIVCSHICPQENQCEGHCVLGKKSMPVHISAIEQYISDYYLNIHTPEVSSGESGRVAIIGSGPAGITIAFLLSQRNYHVTLYEGNDQIGGILRYGIPEFRLPKSILDRLKAKLLSSGVKIRPNTTIGACLSIDDLFRDGFQAVFVGTGVWRPNRLGIKGESLGHVHFAIEYLRNPAVYDLGERVLVIGAGNVAMDVARTALRHRSREVYIICDRGESAVTAHDVELAYAKMDGVKFEYFKSVAAFVEEGVLLADSRVFSDENGQEKTEPVPGTQRLYPANSVIIAVGQGPRAVIVSSTEGIDVSSTGLVVVDECGRTTREGVFASGDVVTGAKTVVEAVRVSRRVADAIDGYVKGLARGDSKA
ncbi:MAG: NAD(P)-dependent oxidoreductase [Oscillospiraceae bacterium]|nr:NAD(P)-dependent oxidoreductase [Oscillospiraceae bacterium]